MRRLGLLILLLPILGCARTVVPYVHGPLPPPPSETLRSELGEVWIDSRLARPEVQFVITPAIGKWSGFGRGVGGGAMIGCAILGLPIFVVPPLGIVGCVAGMWAGAIPGGIYGAIAAEPKKSVQTSVALIRNTMASDAPQRKVRDTARELVPLHTSVRLASEESAAATRLEMEVLSIRLDGLARPENDDPFASAGVINPALRLVVTAQARLIQSPGPVELYVAQFEYWGSKMTVPEWSSDEARPLQDEIDRATAALAEQIVDAVFLLYRVP